MMNRDDFLSWVSDGLFADAYSRLKDATYKRIMRYDIERKDSVAGLQNYGILDFVIRLMDHMQAVHGIQWSPNHPTFVINDYLSFVNRQRKIQELKADANIIELVCVDGRLSKMTKTVGTAWRALERGINAKLPAHKRYYKMGLMALYVDYMRRQLNCPETHDKIMDKVLACKEAYLIGVARVVGARNMGLLMRNAEKQLFMKLEDAKETF